MAPETKLAGRYVLRKPLGKGGMGEVWRALDLTLKRDVAVKLLRSADPGTVTRARFLQEAALPAGVQHPGIIVVHDLGYHEGRLFIVTELLRGDDLGKQLKAHPGGLAASQVIDLGIQLADALAAAHEHGIVHRDLKPSNLFALPGGHLKIADFGIARDLNGPGITAQRDLLGTPLYMSPEQWLGQEASPSMDLYAVGCILYEMLTGRPPAPGRLPVAPCDLAPLSDLALRLLARNPADRPAAARDVADALRGIRDALARSATEAATAAAVADALRDATVSRRKAPAPPAIACALLDEGPFEIFLQNDPSRIRHLTYRGGEREARPGIAAPDKPVTAIAAGSHLKLVRVIACVADGVPYLKRWEYERGVWNCWADWINAQEPGPEAPGWVLDAALSLPAAGQLDLFTLDTDGRICRRRLRPGRWLGQNWSAWEEVPAPRERASALAVASDGADCQALAVVTGGEVQANIWQRREGWSGWSRPGRRSSRGWTGDGDGQPEAVDIACASPAPGHLDFVALAPDGHVHHCAWTARPRAWSDWAAGAGPADRVTAIAAASPGERRVAVTALAADGTAYYHDYTLRAGAGPQWSPWTSLG